MAADNNNNFVGHFAQKKSFGSVVDDDSPTGHFECDGLPHLGFFFNLIQF
jgi:hypothetical protein